MKSICFCLAFSIAITAFAQKPGAFNVMEYGAKADGKTDNTAVFQKALDAVARKGGTVFVPSGTYLICGSLNIPQGVTLEGVWEAPHPSDIVNGTVICATGSGGDEGGPPFISLNQASCIKGLTIFYPEQDIDNVKPYPWTIQGRGRHCSVIDVTLANPYKGIDFGTFPNQLHYIKNLYGCPLKIGIFVDKTLDIGRIEDVHFTSNGWVTASFPNAPTGEREQRLVAYLHQNLVGFLIGRTDWEYMNNCFVIFPKIGFHFVETNSGMETGGETGAANALLTQCGSDICEISVQVDASQQHAGIAFLNGQFFAQVIVGPTNNGPVKFTNCGFWARGATTNQAVIDGSGTVTFTACHFASWARKPGAEEAPCILVNAGSLIVNGCEFFAEGKNRHELHGVACGGKNHIELGPRTQSASIFGNQFRGGEHIVNNAPATASIQIGLNVK
jgi:hypothetical protein